MSNFQLNHFKLVSLDEVVRLPHRAALFVLCFDCDGLLVKISHSRYPRNGIMSFLRQAAPCREIWLFTGTYLSLEGLSRSLRDRFIDQHVRAGYISVPMAQIDTAVGEYLAQHDRPVSVAVKAAA